MLQLVIPVASLYVLHTGWKMDNAMSVENSPLDPFGAVCKDVRRDLENHLFSQWEKDEHREVVEKELREVLYHHGQAVMYSILRKLDTDLLTEAVDRVMFSLPTFRGESMFTTWAHRIMMGVMYDQRRLDRRRKELSIESAGMDFAGQSSIETVDLLLTIQKILSPEDVELFQEFVVLGNTQQEVSCKLGIPRTTLVRRWDTITRTLRHAFSK
jgi:RNA polymerase sigma factor (sigma-70 family)